MTRSKSISRLATIISLPLLLMSSGCVVAGGYSSGRGFFVWPGTLGLVIILVILFLLFRRRR